jgi:hypothetical protein
MLPRNPLMPGDVAGHKYQTWCVTVDTQRTSVEDLFRPQYWIACSRLRTNDLIRCVADDGSYDFTLKVDTHQLGTNRNAITVSLWPKLTPELVAAAEGDAASEMVPTVMHGKPVPRTERTAKGQWRLIGFDGQPVGDVIPTEAMAEKAYDDYISAYGITHEIDQPPTDVRTGEVAPPTQVSPDSGRPGQFSYAKKKEIAKREAKMAKRREIDERNKARTAERLAAESAA